ncbi:MAG: hypothetical protein KDN19_00285 [Verrucomicrobiae bacterium]|nr:hypothetical protein [Verrucomicrobiae bacterium]
MDTADLSQTARENLRTIRHLMERATIYRAISAGPALLGGILAVGLGAWFMSRPESVDVRTFAFSWLAVLVLVGAFNAILLWRESWQRGARFPSSSTIHGVLALAPAMLTGGVLGLVFLLSDGDPVRGVLLWVMGYGLGLIATSDFAPRSIRALGWAFLSTGLVWFLWSELAVAEDLARTGEPIRSAAKVMAVTFGGFHLVYAVRTGWWKREGH